MKWIFILIFIAISGRLCAEPLNPDLVSGQAVWMAHLDLDQIKAPDSSLGKWFIEQSYKPEAVLKLNAAQATLGIDIRNDITSLTAYGLSVGEAGVVALISGMFDSQRLKTLLGGMENYSVITNEGCEIHSWNKEDNPVEQHYAAFMGTNKVVFASDEQTLVHAIMVIQGRSSGTAGSNLFKISGGTNIFTVAFQSDQPLEWPRAGVLKNAHAGVFMLSESESRVTVKLMLDAVNEEQADNLYKIVEGLRAMAMLSADSKPKAAEAAKNISVDKQEKAVSLKLSCSSSEIIQVLKEGAARKKSSEKKREPFK